MTEEHGIRSSRRNAEEVQQLLAKYKNSGMSVSEFCQKNGLCRSTLYRHLSLARPRNKGRKGNEAPVAGGQVIMPLEVLPQARQERHGGLALVLANGHRIEVQRGFDEAALERLLGVLERR